MKKIAVVILAVALAAMMGMSVFADDLFMPSVEAKVAPELGSVTDNEGNTYNALIVDEQGNQTGISTEGEGMVIAIVSIADSTDHAVAAISDKLKSAQSQIQNATTLADLSENLGTALTAMISASTVPTAAELTVEDLAVSQLFDVSLVENNAVVDLGESKKLTYTIKTDLTSDDFFVLLHNVNGDEWEIVENVVLGEDGTLTVTVNSLSPFALVIEKPADISVDPAGPSSPTTGVEFNAVYAFAAVAFVALAVVFFVKAKKCKN